MRRDVDQSVVMSVVMTLENVADLNVVMNVDKTIADAMTLENVVDLNVVMSVTMREEIQGIQELLLLLLLFGNQNDLLLSLTHPTLLLPEDSTTIQMT
jgi:hypothetical protein